MFRRRARTAGLVAIAASLVAAVILTLTGGGAGPAIGSFVPEPVLTEAFNDAGSGGDPPGTHINGHLHGLPDATYTIEFFFGDTCNDVSTSGGSLTNQAADGNGDLTFAAGLTEIPAGKAVAARATDQVHGGTGGFSNCLTIQPPSPTPSPTPSPSPSPTPSPTPTHSPTPTPTLSPTPTPTGTPGPALIQGDVNCDGDVNEEDFTSMMQYLAGLNDGTQPDPCPDLGEAVPASVASLWGDVDCVNGLNPVDALRVLAHKAGIGFAIAGCTPIGQALG